MAICFACAAPVTRRTTPVSTQLLKNRRENRKFDSKGRVRYSRKRRRELQCQTWSAVGGGGWWGGGGWTGERSERRKNIPEDGIPFIPQTIEFAIRQAQRATAEALSSGEKFVRVELPLGRARSHWYLLSPIPAWYSEASVLAFHFAEMFRGSCISVVVGSGPGISHPVPWIADVRVLDDETPRHIPNAGLAAAMGAAAVANEHVSDNESTKIIEEDPQAGDGLVGESGSVEDGLIKGLDDTENVVLDGNVPRVTIFTSVTGKQQALLQKRVDEASESEDAIIIFCSFLDVSLSRPILDPLPRPCYICRAYDKLAIQKDGHEEDWSVFIEIAVFEYEWVGNRQFSGTWHPTQENLERFAYSQGATHKKGTAYLTSQYGGCEAGFWPFMTISCRELLPFDGQLIEEEERVKAERSKAKKGRPFGFF